MKKVIVLLTCVGSKVAPSVIAHIRNYSKGDIYVIGIDNQPAPDSVGSIFCDEFYQSPVGGSFEYPEFIEFLVEKHKINVIFPGSDEEVVSLSTIKSNLQEAYSCFVTCSSEETTKLASNKYEMLNALAANGICVPEYSDCSTISDIQSFADKLGYPNNDFILKPKEGRGSKGVKIVTDKISEYDAFLGGGYYRSLNDVLDVFSRNVDELKDFVLMEYLPGEKYSSDILVESGKIKCMVTRSNGSAPKLNPPTQLADIVFDQEVNKYCADICDIQVFDYFIQIETGRSLNGEVLFIETNPRLDATLPITTGVGINYYHEMITYAITGSCRPCLDELSKRNLPIRFYRYWTEVFETI